MKSNFTLIELFIVISILLIMMSLLQPTLHKTIKLAELTLCKNNLKQVSFPLNLYVEDNNSNLPTSYFKNSLFSPWMSYAAAKGVAGNASHSLVGIGVLYHYDKAISESFYCPSMTSPRIENADSVLKRGWSKTEYGPEWPRIPENDTLVRISYNFNPYIIGKGKLETLYKKIFDMPNNKVLMNDVIVDIDFFSHQDFVFGSHVLYSDTSVEFKDIFDDLTIFNQPAIRNTWALFNKIKVQLEN